MAGPTRASPAGCRSPLSVLSWGIAALVLFTGSVVAGCSGDGSTDGPAPESDPSLPATAPSEPGVEFRPEVGPRAFDVDEAFAMIVDAVDVSDDDVFVRLRVVNGGDTGLDMGLRDTWYGPFVVMRDDRGRTAPSFAVEPAGVPPHSVGHVRFRLQGPLASDAERISFELTTLRGTLTTGSVAVPDGDSLRWWTASPPIAHSDAVASSPDGRTVEVVETVDLGSHVEIALRVTDPSSALGPDDFRATLTLADGIRLPSLPPGGTVPSGPTSGADVTLVFLGPLGSGAEGSVLSVAGLEVVIPAAGRTPSGIEPGFAAPPLLPDLIHQWLTFTPLPATRIGPDVAD